MDAWTLQEILAALQREAHPEELEGMARYGMSLEKRLGVKIPQLRKLAKQIGKDHDLALALWQTGIAEAKILAAMIDRPGDVTSDQMEKWVLGFDSWDVCDQVCMNLFDRTPHALEKIRAWAVREEEYVKRAAFALIAVLAWHDKVMENRAFLDLIPVIMTGASDERNYVKKGVSWALRHIGKRNSALHVAAIQAATELSNSENRSQRWVGKDVLKDITRASVVERLNP